MVKLNCVVEHITFQNPENGYAVIKVSVKGYNSPVTIVGTLMGVSVGSVLQCDGEWKVDKKYGNQFAVESWLEAMPATLNGIEKFLGSGQIRGIGTFHAKLIVQKFGLDTINILEHHIDRLCEVYGIGPKRVEMIRESWYKQKDIKNIMIFLQGYGISTTFATKIYRQYGRNSIKIVKDNPYALADDIKGIGFKSCDAIASRMGFGTNDIRRCCSGILYTLNQLSNDGHVYAEEEQLINASIDLLNADEDCIHEAFNELVRSKKLIQDQEAIYLPYLYYSERGTASHLLNLLERPGSGKLSSFNEDKLIKSSSIQYDEVQLAAIRQAMESRVMVLTGGPGTGKTTTTQGIIAALKSAGLEILLAAPTGRAAKRMSEATGMEAKTIHRLLEYSPAEGYKRNDDNPLKGDALIIDECSMIDIALMYSLMKAIPLGMRVIFVGDIDQLPSVGAGNVLRDIIDSQKIPVIRLTRIFRQAQSSRIIMSAHAINKGCLPDLTNGKQTDFFFLKNEDPEQVVSQIVSLVRDRLPHAYDLTPRNIQVLSPMQRGIVGTNNLNIALQEALNPSKICLNSGNGYTFRTGDRVMQTQNDYEKNVFNGDLGYIQDINREDRTLYVNYDGRLVEYSSDELDDLVLAYASTIHKSQGSEYCIVIMPILMNHYVMLQRNLIYTGITRAKKVCILVGSTKALGYAIKNMAVLKRNSKLKERLNSSVHDEVQSELF